MSPKKFYYFLLGTCLALVLFIFIVFIIGNRSIKSHKAQLSRLSSDVQLETEQISNLQKLETEYEQLAPLADKAQSILPSKKYQAEAVALISAIAKKQGLPLTGLNFASTEGLPTGQSQTEASKIAGILKMPISFETAGSYHQLQGLLNGLEKQQRYMQVSSLDITRSDEDNSIKILLSLDVFLKP